MMNLPTEQKAALMAKLATRGIREAAEANDVWPGCWTIYNDAGEAQSLEGWYQPIFNADGSRLMNTAKNKVVQGWKNADSKGEPHDTWANYISGVKPLMLPKAGIVSAIGKAKGVLNLVEGKADTLTMWQVKSANTAGIFGASFVPSDFDALLQSWGVQKLRFFFHNDEAGRKSAQKVCDLLSVSKVVEFHLLALPVADGHKVDINDIWRATGFNPDDLIDALKAMPEETFTASAAPVWRPTAVVPSTISTDRLTRYGAAVLRGVCDDLATVQGARNDALNSAAFKIGQYVGAGAIERGSAEQELNQTGLSMGLGPRETPGTVRSGLNAGEKQPIDLSRLTVEDEKKPAKPKDLGVAITRAAGGDRPQHEMATVEPAQHNPEIVTWGAASQSLKATLSGKGAMGVNLLPMPFKVIAQLGGLSEIFVPGKIYGVVADSGAGKTSFIETMIDAFRLAGFSGVGWGPEWSPEEYVMRGVQRNGGPGILELYKHAVYAMSESQPINLGVKLSPERLAQAIEMIDRIEAWPGQYDIVPNAGLPVDLVVEAFEAAYLEAESQGRRFAFAVVDYAQLLNVPGAQGVDKMMEAMTKFKDWCIKRALVGIVGSQITKADSRSMSAGGSLTHAAMQNMRSDYFNWAGAIERVQSESGETTPDASMHVLKSSLGGKQGSVSICQDPNTGKWYSGQWAAVQPSIGRALRVIEPPSVQRPMSAPLPPKASKTEPVITDTPRAAMFAKYGSTFNVKVGGFVEPRMLQLVRVKAATAGQGEAFEALLTTDEKQALTAMLEGSSEAPKYIEIKP